jgi:hypothetical protein
LPRGRRIPKLRRITVAFGSAEPVEVLRGSGTGRTDEERISTALRDRVAALGAAAVATPETAAADPAEGRTDSIR